MSRELAVLVALLGFSSPAAAQPVESFESFIKSFEPTAVAAGVTHETYAKAMYGLTPDPNVPELVTGLAGVAFIGASVWSSIRYRKRMEAFSVDNKELAEVK